MSGVSKIMDSEHEIMKVLWKTSPLTTNEIYSAISEKKDWSKSTVITLVNRLVGKGAVSSTKRGVYYYEPIVSEMEYTKFHADSFLDKMFNGSVKNLLAYFCDSKGVTVEDVEGLRKMIESREE